MSIKESASTTAYANRLQIYQHEAMVGSPAHEDFFYNYSAAGLTIDGVRYSSGKLVFQIFGNDASTTTALGDRATTLYQYSYGSGAAGHFLSTDPSVPNAGPHVIMGLVVNTATLFPDQFSVLYAFRKGQSIYCAPDNENPQSGYTVTSLNVQVPTIKELEVSMDAGNQIKVTSPESDKGDIEVCQGHGNLIRFRLDEASAPGYSFDMIKIDGVEVTATSQPCTLLSKDAAEFCMLDNNLQVGVVKEYNYTVVLEQDHVPLCDDPRLQNRPQVF